MPTNDPEINCGISIFPKTDQYLSVFKNLKWFLAVACFSAIVQGATHSYYNRTVEIWRNEYNFSESLTDWVIVANELAQGILGLIIINSSNKRHRIIWIAGTLAIFAVASFSLLIPELVHPMIQRNGTILEQFEHNQLCHKSSESGVHNLESSCWTSLIIMFMFQIALGTSIICLYVHGVLYIDDHETTNNAIILIGIFLASKQLGSYIGVYFSWLSMVSQGTNIFGTVAWIVCVVLLLLLAALLSLFPKYLNESIKLKSIIYSSDVIFKPDLYTNVRSIFRNKAAVLNIFSAVFFVSAIGNFNLIENQLIQSKFLVTDEVIFHGTLTSHIVTAIIKPILVFAVIILSGFVISKFNVKAVSIGIYNAIIPLLIMIICITYTFLGCNNFSLSGTSRIRRDWCSSSCANCKETFFEPVCFQNSTEMFLSPCYAGCTTFEYKDGLKIFQDCSCSGGTGDMASVSCLSDSCDAEWITVVILRTVFSVLTGSVIVGHTILNLYIPHFTERPYALATESSLIGIIAYGPMRLIYLAITNAACSYYAENNRNCYLYNANTLSQFIVPVTSVLLICASLFSFLTAFFTRNLKFYRNNEYQDIIKNNNTNHLENTSVEAVLESAPASERNIPSNPEEVVPMLSNRNENTIEVEVHTTLNNNEDNPNSEEENADEINVKNTNSMFETSF